MTDIVERMREALEAAASLNDQALRGAVNESPRTLGDYRRLCVALGGEDCAAVKFLDVKIAQEGPDEIVLADESQMVALLVPLLVRR